MKKQIVTMLLPIAVLWALGFRFDLVHMDFAQSTVRFSDGHTLYCSHMYWSVVFGIAVGCVVALAVACSIIAGYRHSPKMGKCAAESAGYQLILLLVIALYSVLLWQIVVDYLHSLIHWVLTEGM